MPNANRDRGIRAENDACRQLERVLGLDKGTIIRRKNEGIADDVGDLVGRGGALDGLTVQVSAVPKTPAAIWQRAQKKTEACTAQQSQLGNPHGVTLLRIDGGVWRAVATQAQLDALDVAAGWHGEFAVPPGTVVHFGPVFLDNWLALPFGLWVASLERWALDWTHRQ